MKQTLKDIEKEAAKDLKKVADIKTLEEFERKYLHKKVGILTNLIKGLPQAPTNQRKKLGKELNTYKQELIKDIEKKKKEISKDKYTNLSEEEWIDVTAPSKPLSVGHLHLISQAIEEISVIFERLGFARRHYPEVETDFYAFESLNMPKGHPARDEWETFYISKDVVLTPHTSSGQVREMERGKLPIRLLNISRCDRRQSDITHIPTFYQFEGLLVDEKFSIANLKGVLSYFVKNFFGKDRKIRLRPTDFRFTEPSFEIDVSCGICGGRGCRTCKAGWMELGGAGMVHPNVLRAGKLDPNKVSGFAFGWGVERTFMTRSPKVRLPDIRIIYKNDLRFLEQF